MPKVPCESVTQSFDTDGVTRQLFSILFLSTESYSDCNRAVLFRNHISKFYSVFAKCWQNSWQCLQLCKNVGNLRSSNVLWTRTATTAGRWNTGHSLWRNATTPSVRITSTLRFEPEWPSGKIFHTTNKHVLPWLFINKRFAR
jgi:hypothetical protein